MRIRCIGFNAPISDEVADDGRCLPFLQVLRMPSVHPSQVNITIRASTRADAMVMTDPAGMVATPQVILSVVPLDGGGLRRSIPCRGLVEGGAAP
jgi:hypothetical protein